MSLEVDTTCALRGGTALAALVRAVIAANEHDESEAVEWKETLDLATREGCFHIARAVLGMANRNPDRAITTFEGYGYVVVGAAPARLPGIATVDPANLIKIEQHVGGERGPVWTPTYVSVGGKTALVVTVEPPNSGHPIWPLRRSYGSDHIGRVFVRKPGRTVPANDADIDMLSARAAAITREARVEPRLSVSVVGNVPLPWVSLPGVPDAVTAWVQSGRTSCSVARTRQKEGGTGPMSGRRRSCRPPLQIGDPRAWTHRRARERGIQPSTLGGITLRWAPSNELLGRCRTRL